MSYYFIGLIWISTIVIVYLFFRSRFPAGISTELKNKIGFYILYIPLVLFFLKVDRAYNIFDDGSILLKGLLLGIILIISNTVIYRVTYWLSKQH